MIDNFDLSTKHRINKFFNTLKTEFTERKQKTDVTEKNDEIPKTHRT